LADYNIDFEVSDQTLIKYESENAVFKLEGKKIEGKIYSDKPVYNPIYIPAERIFFSVISQSIFGLINSNISLSKCIIDFGAKFEQARNAIKKLSIDFLNTTFEYNGGTEYVQLPKEARIKLSQASSGLQSVIPLLLVVQYNTQIENAGNPSLFVLEEPELNLYPSSQKDLIEFIIKRLNLSGNNNKLIITTHSPYLLTSLDNLIQAGTTSTTLPGMVDVIKEIIPSEYWVNFDSVSCYYFDNATCHSTLDMETRSIGPSNIDDVSITISDTFEKLLAIKYPA
jgi:hypothetical protein